MEAKSIKLMNFQFVNLHELNCVITITFLIKRKAGGKVLSYISFNHEVTKTITIQSSESMS